MAEPRRRSPSQLSKENKTVAYQYDSPVIVGDSQLVNELILILLNIFKEPAPNPIRYGDESTISFECSSRVGKATIIKIKHTKNEWLYYISAQVTSKKDKESLARTLKKVSPE